MMPWKPQEKKHVLYVMPNLLESTNNLEFAITVQYKILLS